MALNAGPHTAAPGAEWRVGPGSIELERARSHLDAQLSAAQVDARAVHACELVLEEWLTNVWRHGYRQAPDAFGVLCRVRIDAAAVVLAFTDAAPPFDPCAAPPPARPKSLADAEPGGLGLSMIRRVAERCDHERRDGLNHLSVRIRRAVAQG